MTQHNGWLAKLNLNTQCIIKKLGKFMHCIEGGNILQSSRFNLLMGRVDLIVQQQQLNSDLARVSTSWISLKSSICATPIK